MFEVVVEEKEGSRNGWKACLEGVESVKVLTHEAFRKTEKKSDLYQLVRLSKNPGTVSVFENKKVKSVVTYNKGCAVLHEKVLGDVVVLSDFASYEPLAKES